MAVADVGIAFPFCKVCRVASLAGTVLLLVAAFAVQVFPLPVNYARDIQLYQLKWDDDPTLECTTDNVLFFELDAVALPSQAADYTVAISFSARQITDQAAVLLSAAGLVVNVNRLQGWMILSSNENVATYSLPGGNVTLLLVIRDRQSFKLCLNTECPTASSVSGYLQGQDGWLSLPDASAGFTLTGISLGSRNGRGIDGTVYGLWVLPGLVLSSTAMTDNGAAAPQGPLISFLDHPTAVLDAAVVGTAMTLSVQATGVSSSPLGLKLQVTAYGVAPADCQSSSCGDLSSEVYSSSDVVSDVITVNYPRAGRYIIRAQASDMLGGWSAKDFEVLVRKVGDLQGKAPCCRSTALIITQQLGRPIDPTTYRPEWLNTSAAAVGWDWDYLMGPEDLEAERLFDYGLLAPTQTGPVKVLTCADVKLAGPGSPDVWGVSVNSGINASSNQGHNKRVAILPQGFSWAPTASGWSQELPTCVVHWTPWVGNTPYGRFISSRTAGCSYTCTPEGVQQLVSMAGTYDRWAEALIESTFGQLSLAPDPVVLPTLYMPQGAEPGQTAFSYSEAPIMKHLESLGYDMQKDFHTLVVLSPLPRFINPGYTAWANGGGSPLLFIMRCNPQHYYLLHETGHRLGMSHATVLKLNAGPDAVPPTSPLGEGIVEDKYADRLDIMACCKGDYSLYNRILSGWVPGSERVTLGLADMAAGETGPVVRRFTLWPYDRPESKGKLKSVTLRIEDGKVLVLGYRSTPFWQDVRIGTNKKPANNDRPLMPEHMRSNVAGLSVEYSKRYLDDAGVATWSVRGLLDFNMAFARFPAALPASAGAYPPDPPGASFTLLKEGDAWLDEEHNLLVAVERMVPCAEPLVPVYRYGVHGFYGFRGENPGEEATERADYTGYTTGMKCLQLRVVTSVATSPGTLDAKVRMNGLDDQNRLTFGGSQCGFPIRPSLQLLLPAGVDVLSIIWRDNLNRTVAMDTMQLQLPPLSPLTESSMQNTDRCNLECDWRFHVKVLATDGSQTQMDISIGTSSLSLLSMTVTYNYYLKRSILQAVEGHTIPVVSQSPATPQAAQGRLLISDPVSLQALASQLYDVGSLPDVSCSGQWSISVGLTIPAAVLALPDGGSAKTVNLLQVLAGSNIADTSGWPSVLLKVSSAGTSLLVRWGNRGQRELTVAVLADSLNQVAVVRDGTRLGAWVNSQGGWLVDDVRCWPDYQAVSYCSKADDDVSMETTFQGLRVGLSTVDLGIVVSSLRAYNFAIPRASLATEFACLDNGSCGRFLLFGFMAPPADEVASGTIALLQGTVPTVGSTPISLQDSSYYLLVGPWSSCSAQCGGGWATREVRCMKLGGSAGTPVSQVPLEDCPLGEGVPSSSKRCNTVVCPRHALQLLAAKHSSCGKGCQLQRAETDGAQLLCINSLGQPQPLSQCCQLCNTADWANITWSNSLITLLNSTQTTSVLGNSVRVLSPGAVDSNQTLQGLFVGGQLASVCDVRDACVTNVRWQLGSWGSCTVNCGGGSRFRSASCVNAQTGQVVADSVCTRILGAVPAELLTAMCGTAPCGLYTWQVGGWSSCSGDAALGHSSRTVTCIDFTGAAVSDASNSCKSQVPVSSAVCARAAATAVCRPAFVEESDFGGKECYGHGTCTMTGCTCKQGWHGQFCEVPPACRGAMDKSNKCCDNGVLDFLGTCCPKGSALDKLGACCASGKVDICGVCDGTKWAVDIMGVCCDAVLDALGACCMSGAVDECGVCDGDGTTCSFQIELLVQVMPGGNTSTNGASSRMTTAAVQTSVGQMLQAAVRAVQPLASAVQLQVQQVTAAWVPVAATSAWSAAATRQLLCDTGSHGNASFTEAASMQSEPSKLKQQLTEATAAPAAVASCRLSDSPQSPAQQTSGSILAVNDAVDVATGAVRHLQQAAVTTSSATQTAEVNVLLLPAAVVATAARATATTMSFLNDAAGSNAASTAAISLTDIGYKLVLHLQQKYAAPNGTTDSSTGQPAVQVLRISMAQRLGICGNGVCEVGERELRDSSGSVLHAALGACLQDCPLSFTMCPGPVGHVGNQAVECGGNGRCLRGQGVCDCFAGYTGESCDTCLAAYHPHAGRCVPQFISGRNVFYQPGAQDEAEKHFAGLVLLIIALIAAACGFASLAWILWRWMVFGHVPRGALAVQKYAKWLVAGARAAPGFSRKYLLGEQNMELSTAAAGAKAAAADQDMVVKNKTGVLRRRTTTIGSGTGVVGDAAEVSSDDNELLKAIRSHAAEEHVGHPMLPAGKVKLGSPSLISRISGVGSNRSTRSGGGGPRYSSLGGAADADKVAGASSEYMHDADGGMNAAASSPGSLTSTLSGVYSALQLRVSSAGNGIARMVSDRVSRISFQGSGYERIITNELGAVVDSEIDLQWQQQSKVAAPADSTVQFQMPGVSALPLEVAAQDAGSVSGLFHAATGEVARPGPSAAVLPDTADDTVAAGMSMPFPRLAHIRTRPSRLSTSGAAATAAQQQQQQGKRASGALANPAMPGLTRPPAAFTRQGNSAASSAASSADDSSSNFSAAASAGSIWRTRADYQASLASSSGPLLAPHVAQQARDGRVSSAPGQQSSVVRDSAGLPGFVATPTAGSDATNRNAIQAFGQRMERWFSPETFSSSGGTLHSSDDSWSYQLNTGTALEPPEVVTQLGPTAAISEPASEQMQGLQLPVSSRWLL